MSEPICTICRSVVLPSDACFAYKCFHLFHLRCVVQMFNLYDDRSDGPPCPVCRRKWTFGETQNLVAQCRCHGQNLNEEPQRPLTIETRSSNPLEAPAAFVALCCGRIEDPGDRRTVQSVFNKVTLLEIQCLA